jgi:hypothetical protein
MLTTQGMQSQGRQLRTRNGTNANKFCLNGHRPLHMEIGMLIRLYPFVRDVIPFDDIDVTGQRSDITTALTMLWSHVKCLECHADKDESDEV